jgi:ABC-type multidrug transport system fused ATPase/permease subunit
LTSFVAKKNNLGKTINILSSDMNIMEIKLVFLFRLISFLFLLIGCGIMFVWRLKYYGLICLTLPLLFMPLQIIMGKINGNIFKNISKLTDKRISLTK